MRTGGRQPANWRSPFKRPHFFILFALLVFLFSACFFLLPSIVVWQQSKQSSLPPFPIGVDPKNKTITEQPGALLDEPADATLPAAASEAGGLIHALALLIASSPAYESVAAAADLPRIITVIPGVRKEQVATLFGKPLAWDTSTQKMFLQLPPVSNATLSEGTIPPGDYAVPSGMTVAEVQAQIQQRFEETVLVRYTDEIQKIVPLNEGLTIASILERETSDPEEMRIISGVIWNRMFAGMKLQMDSTLQYAKAAKTTGKSGWWPQVYPKDKYIESPYNTYENVGLPPGPISAPSTAAVLAALNPKKTSCLFYFHDDDSTIHCSDTYAEHVAELKKTYGQGR